MVQLAGLILVLFVFSLQSWQKLLLFCFLESQLKAPKILSKLELKTTSGLYVNGADGVHFLKLEDGNYQLIFGESKMYVDIKKLLIMH